MFIRTKNIKDKDYAYLVENKWTKKGSRQKAVKYLGRVYSFKNKDIEFSLDEKKSYEQLVFDLVKWELFKNEFKTESNKKNILFKKIGNKKIKINLNKKNVFENSVVIKNNDGFLCNHSMKNVLNFDLNKYEDEKDKMFAFAKAFVDAGIKVPEEAFVHLYEKKIKG